MSRYSEEPEDKRAFTRRADRLYGRLARIYDIAVRRLPVWRRWLDCALPHIRGLRVLALSFGTGYLLSRYADRYETFGADLNAAMVEVARQNLARTGGTAHLLQANVEALPYRAESFDTVVNTMAFSGYPDAAAALAEIRRVLKPGGRLVLIDVDYPANRNPAGTLLASLWKATGDVIRPLEATLQDAGFDVTAEEIGGFGSVHLCVAQKLPGTPPPG